ncbi:hypothetical protein AB0H42_32760 [Nocardia sp. NPDC050799]|uniref:hypothetical protein n=1 Tax=Nocardia sp. NPDC050799 TaxID=3154842 RepID=UPI0033FDAB21
MFDPVSTEQADGSLFCVAGGRRTGPDRPVEVLPPTDIPLGESHQSAGDPFHHFRHAVPLCTH